MNVRQCKELKKAIIEKFPQFANYKQLKSSTDFKAKELYEQFRKIYQKAKEQYEATPTDKRGVVVIK